MRKFFAFIAIGSFFATVEEFLTVVVLRNDLAAYIFTLLILFPAFLAFVYLSSKLLDNLSDEHSLRDLVHFLVYGFLGLMIEWFVIGLSPWSNPDANPIVMLLVQFGMFSFWSTVSFAPRLFLTPHGLSRHIRKQVLWFYIPYFALVYAIGLSVPARLKFITIVPLVIVGYVVMNVFCLSYFLRAFSSRRVPIRRANHRL